MRNFAPIIVSLLIGIILTFSTRWLVKHFTRRFWREYTPRFLPYALLVSAGLWALGRYLNIKWIMLPAASITALLVLVSLLMIITLPPPLVIERLYSKVKKMRKKDPQFDPSRRIFIRSAATALPVFALGTAGTGMTRSFEKVIIPERELRIDGLPDDLEGFRILHLTDLHLGYYFQLPDLKHTVEKALNAKADLVLVTGDIADDLTLLPQALRMIDSIPAKHGKYLSLGNHEYIRGIDKVNRIIEKGPLPPLVNSGLFLRHKNTRFFLAGADDPRKLRSDISKFLDEAIATAVKDTEPGTFKILMSHRPRALDFAGKYDVDLVLSGHTHGSQVGINGRSIFEGMVSPEPYLWGHYQKQNSHLYTSAGLGHWFPFRLNCPAEAPLIILRKNNPAA